MQCPGCGAANREGAEFCRDCGQVLIAACPACGPAMEPGSRFCDACGAALRGSLAASPRLGSPASYTPPHLVAKILAAGRQLAGERKQVTVLFCDIANSTALAEALGAETMHGLLDRFFELVLTEVHRYEGTVNQFLGDGFMALFGAPLAHEDHARRAVLAAVGIRRRLVERREELGLPAGTELSVRMGLNTGAVVVGKIGDNLRMDYTAIGDTTNLAARLQQLAEPGTILMTEASQRLVEGAVESAFVGEWEIRGKTGRQPVYRLDALRPAATRFDLARLRGLTRLVGREAELALLEACYREACGGRRLVVDLVGEAGIGKSRLVYELRRRLPAPGSVVLQGHCTAYGRSTAFLTFIEVVRSGFGIGEADDPAEAREKLRRGLAGLGPGVEAQRPFLLNLLGLDPHGEGLRGLDGEIIGARTREALDALLRAQCGVAPTVLVVEDLHWIDRASEELLERVIQGEEALPLLVVCAYRPDYRPPWAGRANVRELHLEPLPPERCLDLVRHRLEAEEVPAELARFLADKTEGNPLFAEEMVRYLLESERLQRTEHGLVFRSDGQSIGIPATVHDLIMARVDRLAEPHREILQVASVVGRRFPVALLRAVSGTDDGLTATLRDLEAQELIFREDEGGEEYRFKHVLVQDAIYASLLRPRREELHRRVAEAIERVHASRLTEWTEVLAHHYAQTGLADRAVRYLAQAGEKSLRVYSLDEADGRFRQVLRLIEAVPECADDVFLGDLLLAWVRVYYYRKDFRELIDLIQRYLPRLEVHGDRRRLSLLLFWLGFSYVMGARGAEARPILERALALGEALGAEECIGYASMGLLYLHAWWVKPAGEARDRVERYGQRALESARRLNDVYLASKCLLALGNYTAMLGRLNEAREVARRLVELGRGAGDPRTTAMGLYALAFVDAYDERFEEAIANAEGSLRLSPDPVDRLTARGAKGTALALMGRPQEGLEILREVRRETVAGGFQSLLLGIDIPFGVAMVLTGDLGAGVRWIEEAMRRFAAWGNEMGVAFAHLTLGEIYLRVTRREVTLSPGMLLRNLGFVIRTLPVASRKARRELEQAVQLTRELGMRAWLGRSLLALGLLCQAEGRAADARRHLEEAREAAGAHSAVLGERIRAALASLDAPAASGVIR